jgi:hypothetical protein
VGHPPFPSQSIVAIIYSIKLDRVLAGSGRGKSLKGVKQDEGSRLGTGERVQHGWDLRG